MATESAWRMERFLPPLRAIDIEKQKNSAGQLADSSLDDTQAPIAEFINKIAQYAQRINSEGATKIVDENGEPLVVYHGSDQWFTVFNNGNQRHHSQATDGTFFLNDKREIANSFIGGNWFESSEGERSRYVWHCRH